MIMFDRGRKLCEWYFNGRFTKQTTEKRFGDRSSPPAHRTRTQAGGGNCLFPASLRYRSNIVPRPPYYYYYADWLTRSLGHSTSPTPPACPPHDDSIDCSPCLQLVIRYSFLAVHPAAWSVGAVELNN
eukprot:GHVU01070757.1.p1 GENE.GHVU01070757.1~~GHVU01070757.1.p1  ORF type:complete len:128 (-),score=0.32 GHVU01070757.1:171-554(-)